jgi:hypothetical protein
MPGQALGSRPRLYGLWGALVASRPRFGCYSSARTGSAIQKIAEGSAVQRRLGSAGQAPAERGGLRQQGRSSVHINVLLLR